MNSSRDFALDRMHPSMQLVVVVAPVFSTPRMTMHKWLDSIMTATPWGFKTSLMASATCFVRRSWTCSRRENISARRASFERPKTLRFGYSKELEYVCWRHGKGAPGEGCPPTTYPMCIFGLSE